MLIDTGIHRQRRASRYEGHPKYRNAGLACAGFCKEATKRVKGFARTFAGPEPEFFMRYGEVRMTKANRLEGQAGGRGGD